MPTAINQPHSRPHIGGASSDGTAVSNVNLPLLSQPSKFMFELVEVAKELFLLFQALLEYLLNTILSGKRSNIARSKYQPACLVAGSSGGVGAETALLLAHRGWLVFAGVRRADDGCRLQERFQRELANRQKEPPVTAVLLYRQAVDMARPADFPYSLFRILAAVSRTIRHHLELWRRYCGGPSFLGQLIPVGLDVAAAESVSQCRASIQTFLNENRAKIHFKAMVSCAGCALSLPIELAEDRIIEQLFKVNYFGQLALARQFLPLLRLRPAPSDLPGVEHRHTAGHLVFIGSLSAGIPWPFTGVHSASKQALEASVSALRNEIDLLSAGGNDNEIGVHIIHPACFHSRLWLSAKRWQQSILQRVNYHANLLVESSERKRYMELLAGYDIRWRNCACKPEKTLENSNDSGGSRNIMETWKVAVEICRVIEADDCG